MRCTRSAADALWWARALGTVSADGARHHVPNLIPFSPDRVPRRKGWSIYAHRGDPEMPHGVQRQWLSQSAKDPTLYAWALLPGQAGLVVVDVDDPDVLDELLAVYGDTPVQVRTPRGGRHLYYLAPGDEHTPGVPSRTGVRGAHSYDIKSDGLPCHAAMQRHHSLRDVRYEVDVPGGWQGERWEVGELRRLLPTFRAEVAAAEWAAYNPIPETPEHLDECVLACTLDELDAARRYLQAAGSAVDGSRHEHTRKLILKLGDLGYPREVAENLLVEWNRGSDHPWTAEELAYKVEHYYRRRNLPIGWRASEMQQLEDGEFDDPDMPPQLDTDELIIALNESAATDADASASASTSVVETATFEVARHAAYEARLEGGGPAEVAAAARAAGVPSAAAQTIVGEVFGPDGLPHIDVADLFADVPAALEQCLAVQEAVRMSSADVPALFALGFASATLAARCRVEIAQRFKPPPHLFVVASVPSGRGKSAALSRMGETMTRRWQDDAALEWDVVAEEASVRGGIAKSLYDDYQRQAVKLRRGIDGATQSGADALGGVAEQRAQLERVSSLMTGLAAEIRAGNVSRPSWIHADSTPEKLVDMVKEHGFALLMAGEGSVILQAFTQGYTGNNRVAALLSAWTGEALDRARVGNGTIKRPDRFAELHACMVLPVQAFLLEPGSTGSVDRDRSKVLQDLAAAGFFARCLVAREEVTGECSAPLEFDETWLAAASKASTRHDAAQAAWDDLLVDVWLSGYHPAPAQLLAPERGEDPHSIAVEPAALNHLLRFQSWAAEHARPNGRWFADRVAESAARVGEQAMRVAAVLACMRTRSCIGVEITLAEAERAVRFCMNYAMPIIAHILERAKPDPIADDAEVVRRKTELLQAAHPAGVPRRVLQQKLGRGWGKQEASQRVGRLDAAIEHLEVLGQVSVARSPKGSILAIKIPPPKKT